LSNYFDLVLVNCYVVPPPGRIGRQSRDVLTCFFVIPTSVCVFVAKLVEYDILKTIKPILMPVGTSGPRGKGMKRSTLSVRRSKVKVM